MNYFPNLARHHDGREPDQEVNAAVEQELLAADIIPKRIGITWPGEVPTSIIGSLGPWGFKRAWRYWVAEGPGIPVGEAERLHATHGQVVRVAGHCGCPSPREWFKGFGVGCYHVDTQEGLNALADVIRGIVARPLGAEDGFDFIGLAEMLGIGLEEAVQIWREVRERKAAQPEGEKGGSRG